MLITEQKTPLEGVLLEIASEITTESSLISKLQESFTFKEPKKLLEIGGSFDENLKKLGDSKPMFITAKINSGFSRFLTLESVLKQKVEEPNRFWPKEVIWSMAEQIRKRQIPGYNGHDAAMDMSTIPADIPIIWLTAIKAVDKATEQGVTLVRGYVLPTSKMRDYLNAGVVDSFSVFTLADGEWKESEDGKSAIFEVSKAAILSFDPVRKGTEGILGTKILTTESANAVDPELLKLIASLNLTQLEQANPALLHQIQEAAKVGNNNRQTTSNDEFERLVTKHQQTLIEMADHAVNSALVRKLCETFKVENGIKLVEYLTGKKELWETSLITFAEAEVAKTKYKTIRENVLKSTKAKIASGELTSPKAITESITSEITSLTALITEMAKKDGIGINSGNVTTRTKNEFLSESVSDFDRKDEEIDEEEDADNG